MAVLSNYTQFGGIHPPTAAITNALAAQGVVAPHTGKPFTEAMLLGIGGGLGAGYILWEFKHEASAIIVIGLRNRWNYPVKFMSNLCHRISTSPTVQETTGRKGAAASLQAALAEGKPAITWVDKAHLPHQQLPESLKGYVSHLVVTIGMDDSKASVLVDDLAVRPFSIPVELFAAGRDRIVSDKNRLMLVEAAGGIDLEAAILAGIHDCVEYLGGKSDSFALPVLKKWSRMMTDTRNKKGWPVVFKNRYGLYSTLRSIFEGITLDGTDGQGLRGIYADFLAEACPVVGIPELAEVAADYRGLSSLWSELASAALPDQVNEFKETKDLMAKRYALYKQGDLEGMQPVSARLQELQAGLNAAFPLQDAEVMALFSDLQERLSAIYEAENVALGKLDRAIPKP